MRTFALICLLLSATFVAAGEALATQRKSSVTVVISLEPGADTEHGILVAVFTPDTANESLPLHLYSKDLVGPPGVATKLVIKPDEPITATGPLTVDHETHLLAGLAVYPNGPVALRLPITMPTSADGAPVAVTVLVSYMACSERFCKQPVTNLPLAVTLPSVKGVATTPPVSQGTTTSTGAVDPAQVRVAVRAELEADRPALKALVQEAVAGELARRNTEGGHGIRWLRPTTVAEIERLVKEAHAAGKIALLDFTGPSCVNCQLMDKTVFHLPQVVAAWNRAVAIQINTDPPHDELANWQQSRFQTQNRPLYIRLDSKGSEARWSEVFAPTQAEPLTRFLAFLDGGTGSDVGTGNGAGQFILLALLGGLVTLLMPCTYPMIPFTVNFFAKQAAAGQRLVPLALFYAAGIIGCFVGLGVLITGVLGANLATVAGHPVTNLVIAALFIVLGLSLMGAFLLRLPSSLENNLGGGRSGYLGALVMGLTFAVTAFSCTAPFAGSVLASAVATGSAGGWARAVVGMAIYSGAIAIPFFFLAISPNALKKLPKAGAWMNEFKVVGGLVELAAAFKFLAICDYAWGWGFIGRSLTLAVWAACSLFVAVYVIGRVRCPGDQPVVEAGLARVLIGVTFLALALWFFAGLAGANVGIVESFFPGDPPPGA